MTSSTEDLTTRALHAGEALVHRIRSAITGSGPAPAGGDSRSGWLAVTVLREPADLDPAALPAPLAEVADRIEVRIRPAADDKGTELAVRLRDDPGSGTAADRLSGSDPQAELRSALRRAKQVIEVGEVLAVDPAPHGHRSATPGGALLESWTRAAPKGGVR